MTLRRGNSPIQAARGFTLVELLVAVVIVAALSVAAFSVAGKATARAREVACSNNLRQIGSGLHLYAGEHGTYPETTHSENLDRAWIAALEPYLDDYDKTRICPADPKREERLKAEGTSYILNSFVFVPKKDPFGRPMGRSLNRPQNLPQPGRTLLAFVCSDDVGISGGNDHTHSELWASWSAVTRDISPDRHKDRSNYLFADGRVESWLAADVRKRIESGENIAKPPGT
ncbi:MAG: prepilin-type N-terminal cleavage/methylation domain-containing protein [Akkermansiaceae bacterium]|jgi:prepilin-type N-terminal cleavage/methylation domain-containing protein/prepilin-type processing-associated H-X9-DG protein|nr:prepilin-type N-terminal cleavage/methylation domain-containing protein [Akkermansiaceae bacterium]